MSKQSKSREKKASTAKTKPKAEEQPKVEETTASAEAEKTVEKKAKKERAPKPAKTEAKKTEKPKIVTHGATPIATVSTARGIVETRRQARGFSLPELRAAGLYAEKVAKLGLRVDTRRGTELSENVEALKSWITPTAVAPKKKSGGSSSGKAEEASEAPAEQ